MRKIDRVMSSGQQLEQDKSKMMASFSRLTLSMNKIVFIKDAILKRFDHLLPVNLICQLYDIR